MYPYTKKRKGIMKQAEVIESIFTNFFFRRKVAENDELRRTAAARSSNRCTTTARGSTVEHSPVPSTLPYRYTFGNLTVHSEGNCTLLGTSLYTQRGTVHFWETHCTLRGGWTGSKSGYFFNSTQWVTKISRTRGYQRNLKINICETQKKKNSVPCR